MPRKWTPSALLLAFTAELPAWVCLLPALLLLPFLFKAFEVDDPQFLEYARIIAAHPLNPFTGHFVVAGAVKTVADLPNPLLHQYLLALVRAVLGESEWSLHLVNLGFGVLAMAFLALFAKEAEVPALPLCLLYAACSAFLVMGSNVMPDLAAAACGIGAFALLVRGVHRDHLPSLIGAGLLGGCCFLCRYSGVFVLALLPVYPVLRRQLRPRMFLPAGIGAATLAAWELATWALSGRPHFLSSILAWSTHQGADQLLWFGYCQLLQLGAQLPLLLVLALLVRPRRGTAVLGGAAALLWVVAYRFGRDRPEWLSLNLLMGWPGFAAVLYALVRLFIDGRALLTREPSREAALRFFLVLWLLATCFATIRYVHVAAKYFLLPLPAALMLLLDQLRGLRQRRPLGHAALLAAAALLTLGVGEAVAVSDLRWANMYRDFFPQFFDRFAPTQGGHTYVDADWGFRYYAQKAGALPLSNESQWTGDDVILKPVIAYAPEAPVPPVALVGRVGLSYPGPVALMDPHQNAGFYSNAWGTFPFTPTHLSGDLILIFRTR